MDIDIPREGKDPLHYQIRGARLMPPLTIFFVLVARILPEQRVFRLFEWTLFILGVRWRVRGMTDWQRMRLPS